jgi:hypothetical protein
MSKTFKLTTSNDVSLHKMTETQIRDMVIKQADSMIKNLPKDLKLSEVNSVQLESNRREMADIGGWVQWTRACCDRRKIIENFVDPAIDELKIHNPAIEKLLFQNHFDSNLSFKQITEPESLKKIKGDNK